jgi:hypothetical protein
MRDQHIRWTSPAILLRARITGNPPALSGRQQIGIDGHSGDGVNAESLESIDLILRTDSAGNDQLPPCEGTQALGNCYWKAAHQAFAIDVRV